MEEGPRASAIRRKLTDALAPDRLEIVDDSARHAGHAGAAGAGGESHLNLTICTAAFAGLSRLARQRRVNDLLRTEMAGGLHALSIRALAPGED